MAVKRIVDTGFWTDDKVGDSFSPEDKYFFLYLLTNPHTTQLGIYQVTKKLMAFETGYSVEAITVLLDRFSNKYGIIKYSEKTKEIAIKNYLRHSIVKGGKPVEDLLVKEISAVKDKTLLRFVYSNLIEFDNLNASVKNILSLMNDIDNDNDNDNDDSLHESLCESLHESSKQSKRFTPPTVNQVAEYCKERRNGIDAQRFVDYYTANGWMVGRNKMKDWKATVRTWERTQNKGKNTPRFDERKYTEADLSSRISDPLAELMEGI